MNARVEVEAGDLHTLLATGNHLEDDGPQRWQVYMGDDYQHAMYITVEDARKASEAFFELACRLEELEAAREVVAA